MLCGVLRGVCVVCCVGVGVWWWCCVVWCGVYFCVFLCCFSLFFSQFSSFSFFLFLALSLFLSSLSSFLSSLPSLLFLFFFSLLFSPSNTMERTEAFECDLAQGKCTAVGSLPPPLSSLLPSPPLLLKKRGGNYYRNISGEGIILHYSFKLIQKNRRQVKLQSLQFYLHLPAVQGQSVLAY